MRIVSGKYKGRHFEPPANITARPTTDFAKESLFDLLGNRLDFENIEVLDLFAGTGSIGYEFISRGAMRVTAVEMCDRQLRFIRKTCKDLGITNLHLLRMDVFRYLSVPRGNFDLVFADPPYQLPELPTLPDRVLQSGCLKIGGLFVLEHGVKHSFVTHPQCIDERCYGSVHFSLFKPLKADQGND